MPDLPLSTIKSDIFLLASVLTGIALLFGVHIDPNVATADIEVLVSGAMVIVPAVVKVIHDIHLNGKIIEAQAAVPAPPPPSPFPTVAPVSVPPVAPAPAPVVDAPTVVVPTVPPVGMNPFPTQPAQ